MKRVFWTSYTFSQIMELVSSYDIVNLFCTNEMRNQCVKEWGEDNRCPGCRRVVVEITEKK